MRKRTDYLVVHVTATPPSMDIGAKEINAMHKARGWSGIGYHYVIRRDGTVEKGRAENAVGAHVAGFNSVSLGVSLVGGVDAAGKPQNNMTGAQFASLAGLLKTLAAKYPGARVCGHRDLSPDRDKDGIIEPHEHLKACPCFDAIPWAAQQGLPAAAIRGAWDKGTVEPPAGPDKRIVWLQKLLKRAGYEFGPIDGMVGPKTAAAIKRFQKAAGLPVSGMFDPATVARLRAMAEAGAETVDKPVVPPQVETEVERKSSWWQKITGVFGMGGVGGGLFYGLDRETVIVIGVAAVIVIVVLFVFGRQLVKRYKLLRAEIEAA